jgi:predicted flap endonuclease-1-like 5' DNA nuclease
MTTKVSFRLAAEFVANASEGILLGDFNNWNPEEGVQLQKKEDGSMAAEIALVSGRTYQYRYFLSDGRWVNDFSGTTTWVEVHGNFVENNVIEVPAIAEIKPAVKKAVPKKETAKKAVGKKEAVVADDLSKIEGIGKKIAVLFKKQGILTFKDLSKAGIKNLKAILEAGGNQYSMHNPSTWPKQAKLAAAGKWEELDILQAELKGGK